MTAVTSITDNWNVSKDQFLKLFVTQMKNQNPLDPMDNMQFMSQLSQMTSVEQLTNLNTSFASLMRTQEETYANSLIGRSITFVSPNSGQPTTEKVTAVQINGQDVLLQAGSYLVDPGAITQVH